MYQFERSDYVVKAKKRTLVTVETAIEKEVVEGFGDEFLSVSHNESLYYGSDSQALAAWENLKNAILGEMSQGILLGRIVGEKLTYRAIDLANFLLRETMAKTLFAFSVRRNDSDSGQQDFSVDIFQIQTDGISLLARFQALTSEEIWRRVLVEVQAAMVAVLEEFS